MGGGEHGEVGERFGWGKSTLHEKMAGVTKGGGKHEKGEHRFKWERVQGKMEGGTSESTRGGRGQVTWETVQEKKGGGTVGGRGVTKGQEAVGGGC